ncbi:MAG: hypothetical protein KDE63_09705 [Novosphingobium sp.]|nr:hypothetical protein [Novosphingobium sp.]
MAVRETLKLIATHERVRAKEFNRGVKDCYKTKVRPKISADPALQLLGIAVGEGYSLKIREWIVDLATERGSPLASRWEKFIYPADADEPEPYSLPRVPPRRKRLPEETRFKKGQSGNIHGRPSKIKLDYKLPFEDFLYDQVEISIQGELREISRAEALVHELNRRALGGDEDIARILRTSYAREIMDRWRRMEHIVFDMSIVRDDVEDPPVVDYMRSLHILNRRTVRHLLIQPWAVNAALQRMGAHRLSHEEQAVVLRSTSTPSKVYWPDWWEVFTK